MKDKTSWKYNLKKLLDDVKIDKRGSYLAVEEFVSQAIDKAEEQGKQEAIDIVKQFEANLNSMGGKNINEIVEETRKQIINQLPQKEK